MGKIILVVEDAEDVRRMMVMMLEMAGYTVLEAEDGREAVERTAAEHPDLILMDISMPVMDGLTATKVIRRFDDTPKIPILALTAFGKDYYDQAIKAGCDDLITKPIDFETLEFILKYHLAFDAPRQ